MKNDRITVLTTIMEDPTMNTVGTKYFWWKGTIGSSTDPAEYERAILILGLTIRRTIIPRSSNIGLIMDDIASAWASPPGCGEVMYLRYHGMSITLRWEDTIVAVNQESVFPQTMQIDEPIPTSKPQARH